MPRTGRAETVLCQHAITSGFGAPSMTTLLSTNENPTMFHSRTIKRGSSVLGRPDPADDFAHVFREFCMSEYAVRFLSNQRPAIIIKSAPCLERARHPRRCLRVRLIHANEPVGEKSIPGAALAATGHPADRTRAAGFYVRPS